MKKNVYNWMLMAALVVGLGTTVTSCSDDDDDKSKSTEEQQQEAEKANDDANLFWSVVGQLTDNANICDDYKDKTFEPNVGEPDDGNALVRIVATNDLATAVKRFNDMTGANITENTTTYTWKNDAVGTLTWTRGDSRDYGTVDVDIKQMPKLQKIVYRDGDQMGTNGSFRGRAYYRFGDVVMKDGHYWICVRPAFGPEKKQDSHWVCVDKLDEKNAAKCTKDGKTWYVPKGLGENEEQMRNFAEVLYAMINPIKWYDNLDHSESLTMFHDFKHENLKYHNLGFWKRVYENWRDDKLFEKVMGVSEETVRKAVNSTEGLHFICWGYSWWSSLSWNLTLKQYTYSCNDKKNMKTETELKKEVDMHNVPEFDVRGEYWKTCWTALEQFFDGEDGDLDDPDPRWIIRHAKGKDLCTGKYNEQTQLTGCTDVYTYYTDHTSLKTNEPEVTIEHGTGNIGEILAQNGKFYKTTVDAQYEGSKPVGIVVYSNKESIVDTKWRVSCCGLVMSLEDYGKSTWDSSKNGFELCPHAVKISDIKEIFENDPYESGDRQGHAVTGLMKQEHDCRHPAVIQSLWLDESIPVKSELVSSWFLPTLGELAIVFHYMASHPDLIDPAYSGYTLKQLWGGSPLYNFGSEIHNMLDKLFENAYVPQSDYLGLKKAPKTTYWTATQKDKDNAWAVNINNGVIFMWSEKDVAYQVRPFCAFAMHK